MNPPSSARLISGEDDEALSMHLSSSQRRSSGNTQHSHQRDAAADDGTNPRRSPPAACGRPLTSTSTSTTKAATKPQVERGPGTRTETGTERASEDSNSDGAVSMALTASTTGKKVEAGAAKLRKLASSLKPFGKLPNLLSAQHHARSATTFDKQGGEARQQKLEPEHKLEDKDKDKEHQEKIHDKNSNESLGDPYPTTSTGASPSANDNNNNNNNNNKTSPPATPPTKKAAKKKKRSFFGEMEDDERRETSTAVSESTCTTHTPKRSRTESFARPQTNTTPLGGPVRSSNAGRQDAPRRAILQQSSENAGSDIKKQNTSLRARQDEKENEAATWNALRSSDEDVGKTCDGKDEIEKNGDENDRNQEDDHLEDLEVMNALRRPLSRSSSAATSPSPSPFPPTPFIRTVDGHAMRVPVLDAAPEFTADPLFQAVHDQLAQLVDGVSERADFASNLAGTASELRQRAESLVRSKQAAVGQIKALIEQAGL